MTKVAIVQVKGDGGYIDPSNRVYISAKRETIVPYTGFVESLVNHGQATAKEVIEGSNWEDYVNYVAQNDGDEEKALKAYRPTVTGDNAPEVVHAPADIAEVINPPEPVDNRPDRGATRTREEAKEDKKAT